LNQATSDGKAKISVSPPLDYIGMKYRQQFNISWQELMATPFDVVLKDLEMMDMEADMLDYQQSKS